MRNHRGHRVCRAATVLTSILAAAVTTLVQGAVDVTPAATVNAASDVSSTLSPSYIGMGIEPSNLFSFVGTTEPNVLTNNLLLNLANYTGIPPHIRVGGNTQDTAVYNPHYSGWIFVPNPAGTQAYDTMMFGPKYFTAINNLPPKTPVSMGIGMTNNGSSAINMTVAIAQQALEKLTSVNLVGLEVGNEPDLYILNNFRPSTWTTQDYGNEWIERVEAIYNQVLQPNNIGTAFFEAACTATTAAYPAYKISNLVGTGVGTNNGAYLAGWNQHDYYYYVNVSNYQLTLSELMQLGATAGQFKGWAAQANEAKVTGKPYYVREMGSVGPEGIEGISNTFGNAIWTLNFFLYASTVGVDSVQMHMLQDSFGSPWQPIVDVANQDTFVRPSYYAFAAMNQIIGAKCATKVAQNDLSNYPSSYGNRLAVYSVYDGNNLQTLVLLNTAVAYSGDNNIGSQDFTISLPSLAGQTFYLSLLTAAGADATANVTWNGISYEQTGDGTPTNVDETINTVAVGSDGTLTVTVRDSQIVVANLGSQIGTQNNVVDEKACAALAASTSEGGASSSTSGKGGADSFKSTGFGSKLSLGAIIGIAAGGGVAFILLLSLLICCCLRRSRRRKQLKNDNAALLPPHKGRSYANVPQRDSLDSSAEHDIWMLPLGAKKNHLRYESGSTTPLKNVHSRGNSGSSTPYKGGGDFSRGDASYDNSLYEAPLVPNNHSMREYAPQSFDGHGYRNSGLPVSASATDNRRRSFQAQPAVSSRLAQGTNYADAAPQTGPGPAPAAAAAAVATATQPMVSSRLAHGTNGNSAYPETPYQRGRMQSQPNRTPDTLVPGGGGGHQQYYDTRERNLSTPTRPGNVSGHGQGQSQQLRVRPNEAVYGGAKRSPSAPDSPNRQRRLSPNRMADRSARSNIGHQQYRRGFEDRDAPPVPRMPAGVPVSPPRQSRERQHITPSHSASSGFPHGNAAAPAAFPSSAQIAGPRRQPSPVPVARVQASQNQYDDFYDYNQYPTYHAQ